MIKSFGFWNNTMKILTVCVLLALLSGPVTGQIRDGKKRPSSDGRISRERRPNVSKRRGSGAAGQATPRDARQAILCPYGVTRGWCGSIVNSYCPPGFVCAMNMNTDDPYGVCCSHALSNPVVIDKRRRKRRKDAQESPSGRGSRIGSTRQSSRRRLTSSRLRQSHKETFGNNTCCTKTESNVSKIRSISNFPQNNTRTEKVHIKESRIPKQSRGTPRQSFDMPRNLKHRDRGSRESNVQNVKSTRQASGSSVPLRCPNGKSPLVGKCWGSNNMTCPNNYICVKDEKDRNGYGVCCRV